MPTAALLLGWDNYTSYMKSIGFGDTMPFDLNVAQSQLYNDDTELTLMLLADSGYGQGEILTTPLQMATMFCAFANGGNIMQPYIVDGLYETEGIKYNNVSRASPKVWKSGVIEQHSLDVIVPYLKDVVDHNLNGTGRSLKVTSDHRGRKDRYCRNRQRQEPPDILVCRLPLRYGGQGRAPGAGHAGGAYHRRIRLFEVRYCPRDAQNERFAIIKYPKQKRAGRSPFL